VTELNNIKSYPKIDYGKKYTSDENSKPTINLVIIGHVDIGKSIIVGHLLCLLNVLDKKKVHKNLKVKSNKGEKILDILVFAFATNEASDENERGFTIDTAFKTFSKKIKLL
jgi:elongation factor 1 alpha-like protein